MQRSTFPLSPRSRQRTLTGLTRQLIVSLATPSESGWQDIWRFGPGIALSAALAAFAMGLGGIGWLQSHGMSALTVAILLGIVVANTAYGRLAGTCGPGVNFSKQTLLRAGVILYGLRLTVQDIGHVGLGGVLIDGVVLTSTFALAYVLGTRLFGLDRMTSILIGAGSAICGAAAVMATEPIVRAKAEQVTVAVSCVVVFGTLAIFLYPILYSLNTHWQLIPAGPRAFGIYVGSTIHEVAQVFAAGRSVSIATADTAIVTKMVRVMMLAPFLIALSAWATRSSDRAQAGMNAQTGMNQSAATGDAKHRLRIPWFAFGFIGMVLFNSLALLPQSMRTALVDVDTFILAMAMAALGLTTHVSAIRKAGIKPLLLGGVLFIWLILGGGLINALVARALN
jgi:uncharacterized integral membrane protein (TIGR00698 family)